MASGGRRAVSALPSNLGQTFSQQVWWPNTDL